MLELTDTSKLSNTPGGPLRKKTPLLTRKAKNFITSTSTTKHAQGSKINQSMSDHAFDFQQNSLTQMYPDYQGVAGNNYRGSLNSNITPQGRNQQTKGANS